MANRVDRRSVMSGLVFVGACLIGIFAPSRPVAAHGGGLDSYGCHNDRKAGTYHCHRGPCAPKVFASKEEMLRAACSKGKS